MTAVRALIFVAVCYGIVWLLFGCGSTIRLDYDGGKSGSVGIGITLPTSDANPSAQAIVRRNFPNATCKRVADQYEITISADSIAYVTGPTPARAWSLAEKKLR